MMIMPHRATVHFEFLRYLADAFEGALPRPRAARVNPYLWAVMLSMRNIDVVSVQHWDLPRSIIQERMEVRTRAAIRRNLSERFENPSRHSLVLAVALFEKRDLPEDAVAAGYEAFVETLPEAVEDVLAENVHDILLGNEPDYEEISSQVEKAVKDAIKSALSLRNKILFATNVKKPDHFAGADTWVRDVEDNAAATTFTLELQSKLRSYSVTGRYTLEETSVRRDHRTPPSPGDPPTNRGRSRRAAATSSDADNPAADAAEG